MSKIEYGFRWIAVLPGAIVAGLLVTFPLHWLLYLAFAHDGTLLGFIELPPGANISIEHVLSPFVIALTFIFAGNRIAPKYKFKTAITLFGIYLAVWSIISIIALFKGSIYGLEIHFSGETILSLIGALVGVYIVKKDEEVINNATVDDGSTNNQESTDEELDFLFDEKDNSEERYGICICGKQVSPSAELCKFCGYKLK